MWVRGAFVRLDCVEIGDTLAFLLGSWDVVRSIDDRQNATSGTFVGVSRLVADPLTPVGNVVERATYEEEGELQLKDHLGLARRRLEYRRRPDGFLDGRHFFDLDLTSGRCKGLHQCAPDSYFIDVAVSSELRYTEHWRVTGPYKDYEASTVYSRVSGPSS